MKKIINARIWTGTRAIENGAVAIDKQKIVYVGAQEGAPDAGNCIDAKGGIVMPALYNAHAHSAMTILRGVGSDLKLMDWLNKVMPIEDGLTEEDVYWGTVLACAEQMRRGCVAFADMYYFMDEVARAALDTGIRANISRGCTDEQGADSVYGLYERWHGKGCGRINVYMGVHAEYTTKPDFVQYAVRVAGQLKTGFHVHMAESVDETKGCIERHGVTPVEYFRRFGAYENPTLAAHCVQVTDEDIRILAEHRVSVATNPASNLKLANGVAPISKMREAGVRVALGTDGASSNNTLDMFADMRLMSLLQKGMLRDATALNAADAISIATREGALALGFGDCGLLEEGMRADMILLDASAENLQPYDADLPATIVYAAQGQNVRMTVCDGEIVYRDGAYTMFDIEEACRRVNLTKKRLLQC